jgi:hypothetical protein
MDNCEKFLGIAANVASILTAFVAVIAYLSYQCERLKKRKRLEDYLREERGKGDKGQRTMTHLIAKVGLSEADIFNAAFTSAHIKPTTGKDSETGRASAIFFEYFD